VLVVRGQTLTIPEFLAFRAASAGEAAIA